MKFSKLKKERIKSLKGKKLLSLHKNMHDFWEQIEKSETLTKQDQYDIWVSRLEKCLKHKEDKDYPRPVMSWGSLNAKIMIVGAMPTERSSEIGMPFYNTGVINILVKMMRLAGTDPGENYLTYLTKCFLPELKLKKVTKTCVNYLFDEEVNIIKPWVILCMGISPLKTLIGSDEKKISKLRKRIFTKKFKKTKAYIMATHDVYDIDEKFNVDKEREVFEDMMIVKQVLKHVYDERKDEDEEGN